MNVVYWRNDTVRRKEEVLGGNSVSAPTVFITNTTWIGMGSKPGLRCESPEDNHVKHGTTENLLFKIFATRYIE
jgi:hypothetical protein